MPRATNGAEQARQRAEEMLSRLVAEGYTNAMATFASPAEVGFTAVEATPAPQMALALGEDSLERAYAARVAVDLIDVPIMTPEPGPDLIESVRTLGVHTPVQLRERGGRFEVIAGARRVRAASMVGMEYINAMVYPSSTPGAQTAAITLTENLVRRPNLLREVEAVEELALAGIGMEQIQRQLRLSSAQLRQRIALGRLRYTELRAALADGRLPPSVAVLAARLDDIGQRALADMLAERAGSERPQDRRVSAAEVRALLRSQSPVPGEQTEVFTEHEEGPSPQVAPSLVMTVAYDDAQQPVRMTYEGTSWLPEAWMQDRITRVQIERSGIERELRAEIEQNQTLISDLRAARAEVEIQDEHHIMWHGRPFVSSERMGNEVQQDRALIRELREEVLRLQDQIQRNTSEEVQRLHEQLAQHAATVRATPEGSSEVEEESWAFVHRYLQRLERLMPVDPNGESDQAYHALDDFVNMARLLAEAEALAARPRENLEQMVAAVGGQTADRLFAENDTEVYARVDLGAETYQPPRRRPTQVDLASVAVGDVVVGPPPRRRPTRARSAAAAAREDLMVAGYPEFEPAAGGAQPFRRYTDAGGRLRRRYLTEDEWNTQLRLELERANRGER